MTAPSSIGETLLEVLGAPVWVRDDATRAARSVVRSLVQLRYPPETLLASLHVVHSLLVLRMDDLTRSSLRSIISARTRRLSDAEGGHWLWTGAGNHGVGDRPTLRLDGRRLQASRVAWESEYGALGPRQTIQPCPAHRRCVRPHPEHCTMVERAPVRMPKTVPVERGFSQGRHCVDCQIHLPGNAGYRMRGVGDVCLFHRDLRIQVRREGKRPEQLPTLSMETESTA